MSTNKFETVEVEVISSNDKDSGKTKNVEVEKMKPWAALAYVVFFIPLIADWKSSYGRFHANQGLMFLIYWLMVILLSRIPILGLIVFSFGYLLALFFFIFGIINALNGWKNRLPIIGRWDLIK